MGKNKELGFGFLLILSIFLIYRLSDKGDYIPPFIISLVNVAFIIWFLAKKYAKNILLYIFFLYHILTLKFPLLFNVLYYSKYDLDAFYNFRKVTSLDLVYANIYIFLFDILTICFLYIFKFYKIRNSRNLIRFVPSINKEFLILILVVISYISKLYLISIKIWFFYEMNDIDFTQYKFAGLANILEKLDFVALLYYTFLFKIRKLSKKDLVYFYIILFTSLIFAFISTSKGKILTLLFPAILMVVYSRSHIRGIIILVVSAFVLNNFFDFMMYARYNNDEEISVMLENYGKEQKYSSSGVSAILENKVLYRLEYQSLIARVLDVYKLNNVHNEFGYVQNIIGVIPRVIWKDKPEVGLNTNRIGYEIGVLSYADNYTTIGITSLGAAFYLYGTIGVLWIALFTAFLLYVNLKIINEKTWVGFLLAIMIGIQLARNGTYVNIVPSLMQSYFICIIFGSVLNIKTVDN